MATKSKTNKRKVVMKTVGLAPNGDLLTYEAVDYVPESTDDEPDFLLKYEADARTRWQSVTVEDGYDAGPGGDDAPVETPGHFVGKSVTDLAAYGGPDTEENPLDEHLASIGIKSRD